MTALPHPFISPGDPITAEKLNALAQAASRLTLQPGQFQNGRLNLQAPLRNRTRSGTEIVRGYLVEEIPANSVLEDCIVLTTWVVGTSPGNSWYDNDVDVETSERIAGINSCWSAIRGSTDLPIMVWGVLQNILNDASEVVRALEIFRFDPASTHGHENSPVGGTGQAIWHPSGTDAYQADGGPCSPCGES